jgi:hypothetical protein
MPKNNDNEPGSDEKIRTPRAIFCDSIENMMAWANDNAPLQPVPKFNLDALLSCFPDARKETFLTELPLAAALSVFRANCGNLRHAIPNNTRITAVIAPCDEGGLQLPPHELDDKKNLMFPYFRLLYSNSPVKSSDGKSSPRYQALGMGNARPVPLLALYPDEILTQCYSDIQFPDPLKIKPTPVSSASAQVHDDLEFQDEQDQQDYLYLSSQIIKIYQRLQELIRPRLK